MLAYNNNNNNNVWRRDEYESIWLGLSLLHFSEEIGCVTSSTRVWPLIFIGIFIIIGKWSERLSPSSKMEKFERRSSRNDGLTKKWSFYFFLSRPLWWYEIKLEGKNESQHARWLLAMKLYQSWSNGYSPLNSVFKSPPIMTLWLGNCLMIISNMEMVSIVSERHSARFDEL